jgi:hypothetical protein
MKLVKRKESAAQTRASELAHAAETEMAREALTILAGIEGLDLGIAYESKNQARGDTARLDRITLSGSKAQRGQLSAAKGAIEENLGRKPYAVGDHWSMYQQKVEEGDNAGRYDRLNISGF